MRDVFFLVKFSLNGTENTNGIFEDFETAKAKVAELVESEADFAWVEVRGVPELRTANKHKVVAPVVEPVSVELKVSEKVLDKPSPKAKLK